MQPVPHRSAGWRRCRSPSRATAARRGAWCFPAHARCRGSGELAAWPSPPGSPCVPAGRWPRNIWWRSAGTGWRCRPGARAGAAGPGSPRSGGRTSPRGSGRPAPLPPGSGCWWPVRGCPPSPAGSRPPGRSPVPGWRAAAWPAAGCPSPRFRPAAACRRWPPRTCPRGVPRRR
ncbi:hypothetical protein AZA_90590 [Nitrospirillum viridazoti Y2]|nr:hypothetical protein AZA_90590 [Nitrospirillum amazonense Y2]